MPHLCTGCGHSFEDGSKEMLSGCPECGGNKFQFRPAGADLPDDPAGEPPEADAPGGSDAAAGDEGAPASDAGSVAETVGRATTKVRDFVSTNPDPAGTGAAEPPDPDRSWPSEVDSPAESSGDPPGRSERPDGRDATPPSDAPADADPRSGSDGEIIDADAHEGGHDGTEDDEDVAQASARSEVVTNDELDAVEPTRERARGDEHRATDGPVDAGGPADPAGAGSSGRPPGPDVDGDAEVVGQPTGDDPDLSELREQLNDQFESIKIVEPGQYELNLMELYDREEYIIALQENGRYVIQVPDQWIGDDLDDR